MDNVHILVLGLVFVAISQAVFSLWENPPGGRKPRQRMGGIFHTLCAVPLRGFFRAYCGLCGFLFRAGAPDWLVNSVRLFIPNALLRAGARAFQDGQAKNNAGGQL